MSLPFLRKKQIAGLIMAKRQPDGSKEEISSEPDEKEYSSDDLKACARDLMSALKSEDEGAVAKALKAAFDICEASPHEEGPHTNEEQE